LARESGKTRARIADDLGIAEQTLYAWMKQDGLDNGKRSDGLTTEEHAEVRRLRREVRILQEERDILKKAAAFFAKETNSTP
jgi:transposase